MDEIKEELFKNLHLALRIVGVHFRPKDLELILRIQSALDKKGDELTIKELTAIETEVNQEDQQQ